jgi:hypothetical protein
MNRFPTHISGRTSIALVIAVLAGVPVEASFPGGERQDRLPQQSGRQLRDLRDEPRRHRADQPLQESGKRDAASLVL